MLSDECIDRLLELNLNAVDDTAFGDEDKELIDFLYVTYMGEHVRQCTCRNRYCDALFECIAASSELRQIIKMNQKNKYRLIGGYVIFFKGNHYSSTNITDEIAKEYLSEHPDAADQFEPFEAETEIKETPAKKTKKAKA